MVHVSWAVYHSNGIGDTRKTSISVLLPLFPNDSKSVAMIKHFNGLKECCQYRQPVTACDQPLYKIAKNSGLGQRHMREILVWWCWAAFTLRRLYWNVLEICLMGAAGHLLYHRPTLPHLVQQKVFSKLHMSRRQLGITRWQLAFYIRYDKMPTPKMTMKYLEQISQRSEVQVVYSANF